MPETADGKIYPDATGHTRTWEHWQALAESSSPIVVANDAARPAHKPGRLIWQIDRQSYYGSNGTQWIDLPLGPAGQVYDATYGWIPRTRANRAVVSLGSAGTGSFLLPFSPALVGAEKYAVTAMNTNQGANSAIIVAVNLGATGTVGSTQAIYNGGVVGGCQVDWIASYRN